MRRSGRGRRSSRSARLGARRRGSTASGVDVVVTSARSGSRRPSAGRRARGCASGGGEAAGSRASTSVTRSTRARPGRPASGRRRWRRGPAAEAAAGASAAVPRAASSTRPARGRGPRCGRTSSLPTPSGPTTEPRAGPIHRAGPTGRGVEGELQPLDEAAGGGGVPTSPRRCRGRVRPGRAWRAGVPQAGSVTGVGRTGRPRLPSRLQQRHPAVVPAHPPPRRPAPRGRRVAVARCRSGAAAMPSPRRSMASPRPLPPAPVVATVGGSVATRPPDRPHKPAAGRRRGQPRYRLDVAGGAARRRLLG